MNVHQDADVGLPRGVENQTGDGLGEKGVVGFGGEHALPGTLEHHAPFRPPGEKVLVTRVQMETLFFFIFACNDPKMNTNNESHRHV